jgi:photosystem II stability/assembly factor-like uncharacterized protein
VPLPALETTIDLGPADFERLPSTRLLALDAQTDRLYVSLAPARTVVLEADTLTPVGELPLGGALSVNSNESRLYMGVPGSSSYNPDGTTVITPAELKLFDTTNLTLLQSSIISDAWVWPPLPEVDPTTNKVYIVQGGVYVADAGTLAGQGLLPDTFANTPESASSAVDAALDPQRQRLFVSLNNGIPGSNNGNILQVYDLALGQLIGQDNELSVETLAIDPQTGKAIIPRRHSRTAATVQYDTQGHILKRVDDLVGTAVQIDPISRRIYLLEPADAPALLTLDDDLNLLGVAPLEQDVGYRSLLFDSQRERLYLLQAAGQAGRLLVLTGQGQPSEPVDGPPPDRVSLLALKPFGDAAADRRLMGIFALSEYSSGNGGLFETRDAGVTWQQIDGLPGTVTSLAFGDASTWFVTVDKNGVAPGGWGVWRSIDAGQTWQPASQGLTDLGVMRLALSPDFARDGTLYALSPRGIFRSTDRGATWTSLARSYAPLLQDLTVSFKAIAVSPNFAQDNALLIGHSSGSWRSTDRGTTWTIISGSPAANQFAYGPGSSIVFAVDYNGVHRSEDGGLTWQIFNAGLDLSNSTVGDVQANEWEAVVLLKSLDRSGAVYHLPLGETTWQRLPSEADVSALALTAAGQLFIGTPAGAVQRVK